MMNSLYAPQSYLTVGSVWVLFRIYTHIAPIQSKITTNLTFHRVYTKTALSADAHAKTAKNYVFDDARIVAMSTVSSTMNHPQPRRSLLPTLKLSRIFADNDLQCDWCLYSGRRTRELF
jgi:hypothetical protein